MEIDVIYKLIRNNEIESLKVGKRYMTSKINILKYLKIIT